MGSSWQVHLDVQTGLPVATLGGGGEGSLPTCPPHSSEDVDDAGELPPVMELHTGGGGAVGASQRWLPGQHQGAHNHMTYCSAL